MTNNTLMKNKVAIILGSNIWFAPYLQSYISILDAKKIDYDLISWNRDGKDLPRSNQYNKLSSYNSSFLRKFFDYCGYIKFVRKCLKSNSYLIVILFNYQIPFTAGDILLRKYRGRYILDYRDIGKEQFFLLKPFFKLLYKNAVLRVISSPKYSDYIDAKLSYTLCHNITAGLSHYSNDGTMPSFSPCVILTIGGLRDVNENKSLIDAFSSCQSVELRYVGDGTALPQLRDYVSRNGIKNTFFHGHYTKEQEHNFVLAISFISITISDMLRNSMTNRFYLALLYKKPIIVPANNLTADYVKRYKLGVVYAEVSKLPELIKAYVDSFDFKLFEHNCNILLQQIYLDNQNFEEQIFSILASKR